MEKSNHMQGGGPSGTLGDLLDLGAEGEAEAVSIPEASLPALNSENLESSKVIPKPSKVSHQQGGLSTAINLQNVNLIPSDKSTPISGAGPGNSPNPTIPASKLGGGTLVQLQCYCPPTPP